MKPDRFDIIVKAEFGARIDDLAGHSIAVALRLSRSVQLQFGGQSMRVQPTDRVEQVVSLYRRQLKAAPDPSTAG